MAKKHHIGLMNTYLSLEVATVISGSMNSEMEGYEEEAKIWADLQPMSYQREQYEAQQEVAIGRYTAVIYQRDINPAQYRLNNGGTIYEIVGIEPVENAEAVPGRPMFLKLHLEQKDNNG